MSQSDVRAAKGEVICLFCSGPMSDKRRLCPRCGELQPHKLGGSSIYASLADFRKAKSIQKSCALLMILCLASSLGFLIWGYEIGFKNPSTSNIAVYVILSSMLLGFASLCGFFHGAFIVWMKTVPRQFTSRQGK